VKYSFVRFFFVGLSVFCWSTAQAVSLSETILDARKPNTTPPQFIFPKDPPANTSPTLILFIHGVFGDTIGTWKRPGNPGLPDYLVQLPEFSQGHDTFAFGYASDLLRSGSFSIPEAAKALKRDWDFFQFEKYDRVVIVAHSMGGLVAVEALSTFTDMRAKVPLLVTFATPYSGSQVALLGTKLLENQGLVDMLPMDKGNGFITSLTNRWKELKEKDKSTPVIKCAYETVRIPGIGVIVPPSSSSGLCDGPADAIAENHLGIVKPADRSHPSIKVLVNALRRLPSTKNDSPSQKTSSRRILIEDVDTTALPADSRFVVDKVHRNLAEYLANAGHIVVAPPLSSSKLGDKDETWRTFSIRASSIGDETHIDIQLRNTDRSLISSTELSGKTDELKAIYKVLPEAIIQGLDVNEASLKLKRSAKRPTNDIVALSQFLQARRQLALGDIAGAKTSLTKAIAIDKNFAMTYWAMGELLSRQGSTSEASKFYARARALDPDHPRLSISAAPVTERPLFAVLSALQNAPVSQPMQDLFLEKVGVKSFELDVHVWTVDPRKFEIAVVEQQSPFGNTAKEFLSAHSGLVALQGGFFDMDDRKRLTPAGALVIDGIVRNPTLNRQSGAFVRINGKYDILWAKDVASLSKYTTVLQSGPVLVEASGVNGIKSNDFDRLNRSAVCLRENSIVLVSLHSKTGRGLSLFEFAELLATARKDGGIGCHRALNLDGGPSTQLAFKSGAEVKFVPGLWNAQNALVVRRPL
jgi:tetratricopeptide (TPR) repeat protein/pimeloyl-ACP methyl ester carboxylesterase